MQSDQELFILLFASSGITEKLIHSMEQELSQEIKDRTRILAGFTILCVTSYELYLTGETTERRTGTVVRMRVAVSSQSCEVI